jgi:uncharacterized phage protein gp47/JayE
VNEKHDYVINKTKYILAHPEVLEIVKIDGTVKGASFIFRNGIDYEQSINMVKWLPDGEKPDDKTPFFVNYKLDAPMLITDINPGSVVRTIVEAVALEFDYLYAQMNQIYNAAFIDTATGKSLDLVVSLLGITRKLPEFATGDVIFGRNSELGEIEVSREAHVFDGRDHYVLKNNMIKWIKKIEGEFEKDNIIFNQDQDYSFSDNVILWIEGGRRPDEESVFYADYTAYEQITIPIDTRVSTYSKRPENVKVFRTTREAVLTKKPEGKWEVEVPVVALKPGKEGNVFAGTLNVMPRPTIGIEYVINKKDILNGTEEENDTELRERAKHALEKAGKASLISLKSAVEGVPGITGEVKVVDQPEGVSGIVQIIASGGDEKEIKKVINETRSAGIRVEFKRPVVIPLDIKLTIDVVEGLDINEVRKEVDSMVQQYLSKLNINEDVVLSRIVKSALSVQGVRDVHDITINDKKGNVEVKTDEKGEIRTLEIFVGD